MKKRLLAALLSTMMIVSVLSGCSGDKQAPAQTGTSSAVTEETTQTPVEEDKAESSEATEETTSDGLEAVEAIADVSVEKGLFDVEITIPADIIGEVTQEQLDKSVKENGYHEAKLNDDGSVTYKMTKAQHKEMLAEIKKSVDTSIDEMITSGDYPNFTKIVANDDYTNFTVTTKAEELGLTDSFSVLAFYTIGGMYAAFTGEKVDNIHVDFVNEDSGEVIESADSKNLGN